MNGIRRKFQYRYGCTLILSHSTRNMYKINLPLIGINSRQVSFYTLFDLSNGRRADAQIPGDYQAWVAMVSSRMLIGSWKSLR